MIEQEFESANKLISIEAFAVPHIRHVPNARAELAYDNYPNLKAIWFSHVRVLERDLKVDVLIGLDYLWPFHTRRKMVWNQ